MVYRGCFNCDQGSQRPALVFLVQNVHLNRHNRHRNQEEHDPEYFSHPVCRRHNPPQAMRRCVVTKVLDEGTEHVFCVSLMFDF